MDDQLLYTVTGGSWRVLRAFPNNGHSRQAFPDHRCIEIPSIQPSRPIVTNKLDKASRSCIGCESMSSFRGDTTDNAFPLDELFTLVQRWITFSPTGPVEGVDRVVSERLQHIVAPTYVQNVKLGPL